MPMHRNFFELFEIPMSFQPDLTLVKKQFYFLSKQYHPDFFGSAEEEKKQEALEVTAQINKAYTIFQSTDELIKYVLQLHKLLEEEEKYPLSPDFLMEVMDLNEQIMELEPDNLAAKATRKQSLNELTQSIYEAVKPIITNFKEGITPEKELLQVKDYYYKKKYLERIEHALK
jgi:molecular chaperone HscB